MKTALILGITGNFGSQMAKAFKAEGWRVRALLRDKNKAHTWLSPEDIWIGGVSNEPLIEEAAFGVDVIAYAINPVYYRWDTQALQLLEPTVRVAEKLNIRILFPGNVYNFAPNAELISEGASMNPVTRKGAIRVDMEQRLHRASQQGAKVTIVRAGDFIGPDTHFSWLDMTLKQKRNRAQMKFPHDDKHVHFWSYLPDLCANTAKLMATNQSSFEVWHDDGLKLSQSDWQKAFLENDNKLQVSKFSWWAFTLITPFSPLLKEVMKMRYLWQQPVLLDGTKMKLALQDQYKTTPLADILPFIVSH
ncbi:NAD-dependent epimerase/dehydratase family protein [Vibrio amylolyticus]|uniref:NAD-dependent epimerase/dehydratase family protein n=1 Tax=Vibrio amylolyticus TaxID=2847292 RepID=UPI003552BC0D